MPESSSMSRQWYTAATQRLPAVDLGAIRVAIAKLLVRVEFLDGDLQAELCPAAYAFQRARCSAPPVERRLVVSVLSSMVPPSISGALRTMMRVGPS